MKWPFFLAVLLLLIQRYLPGTDNPCYDPQTASWRTIHQTGELTMILFAHNWLDGNGIPDYFCRSYINYYPKAAIDDPNPQVGRLNETTTVTFVNRRPESPTPEPQRQNLSLSSQPTARTQPDPEPQPGAWTGQFWHNI